MKPGPARAAAFIADFVDPDDPPKPVRVVLQSIIVTSGWADGDDAAELADQWAARFVVLLLRTIEKERSRSGHIHFAFNSADDTYIQGSSFEEPRDDEATKEFKRRRSKVGPIARQIAALDPRNFEKLCGGVLQLFGVTSPKVTQRSADGGIDFYGRAPFAKVLAPEKLPAGVEKDLSVWLVGQSKRYTGKVAVNELRELVGSTELAKAKVFAGKSDPLNDFTPRLCDPIFYMLITSGRFTRDSNDIISRSGIIVMDQMQLAQFLADNDIWSESDTEPAGKVQAWIDGLPTIEVSKSEEVSSALEEREPETAA